MSAEMIELQTLHLEGNDEFAELISGGWLVFDPTWKASRAQIRRAFEDHLQTDTTRRTPPEKAELTRLYQWVDGQPGVRSVGTMHLEDGTRDRGWHGVGVGRTTSESEHDDG